MWLKIGCLLMHLKTVYLISFNYLKHQLGMATHYVTLGVTESSSAAEIKKAYHKLAKKHHPDRGGDADKFRQVQRAYEVLSDEGKRRDYDKIGHSAYENRESSSGGHDRDTNDITDVFANLFGAGGGNRWSSNARAMQAEDIEASLDSESFCRLSCLRFATDQLEHHSRLFVFSNREGDASAWWAD